MNAGNNADERTATSNALLDAVEKRMDCTENGSEMAAQVFLSRFHYQRVFRRTVGEPPGSLRRRLLLERAACELRSTETTITAIALDASYQTLEGFSRAFRRAYGMAPSAYRSAARRIRLLPACSGVHYDPQTRGMTIALPGGKRNMDLIHRLLETDYSVKRRLLECARLLTERQLDAPLALRHNLVRWVEPARTLREAFQYLAGTGDGWVEVMYDRLKWKPEDESYRQIQGTSADAMIAHLEGAHKTFRAFVEYAQTENLLDQEWIDDTCEQPETFSIGGVIEETLTSSIACRTMLERQMTQMGFDL